MTSNQGPLTNAEIRELLRATLHGPLPVATMSRVFATLAEVELLRGLRDEVAQFVADNGACDDADGDAAEALCNLDDCGYCALARALDRAKAGG